MRTYIPFILLLALRSPALVASDVAQERQRAIEERIVRYAEELVGNIPPSSEAAPLDIETSKVDIVLALPGERLRGVERFGFLNLFQVGGGQASSAFYYRLIGEPLYASHPGLEWHPTELRPKSAFLAPSGAESFRGYREQYGEVMVVFRRSVWARTAFAMTDSLDLLKQAVKGAKNHRAHRLLSEANKIETLRDYEKQHYHYGEALVWGPLNLSDVERMYIPKSASKSAASHYLQLAKKYGFALHSYAAPSGNPMTFALESPQQILPGVAERERGFIPLEFDALRREYETEKDPAQRRVLIDAMARSHDPRSNSYLNDAAERLREKHGFAELVTRFDLQVAPTGAKLEYIFLKKATRRDAHLDKINISRSI